MQIIDEIIERQNKIATGKLTHLSQTLPKFETYSICNLRGGIGKTTMTVNIAYYAKDILVADTCPQGNTSAFFDNQHYTRAQPTVLDMIMPYLVPGLGQSAGLALNVGGTNPSYVNRNVFYIPSDERLYLLPTQLATALQQAQSLGGARGQSASNSILNCLRTELLKEAKRLGLEKILIDTSPFFSGATQLSWHAADALVIPVRTDQQSINSLEMLIRQLSDPNSEFNRLKMLGANLSIPKIQMVVVTHCGWSTSAGAQNIPNNATKIYLEKVLDVVARHIQHFSTNNPKNHIFILDDFLGSGRFSSATSRPLHTLSAGDSTTVNRQRVEVNTSVEKCKRQLAFLTNCLW